MKDVAERSAGRLRILQTLKPGPPGIRIEPKIRIRIAESLFKKMAVQGFLQFALLPRTRQQLSE